MRTIRLTRIGLVCKCGLIDYQGRNWDFFRGCHVELQRRRHEDRGAVGAEGWGLGRGVALPRKFLHFLFQNGKFLCMPNLT